MKFEKQVTVDFQDARLEEITDKTFYRNQIVDVNSFDDNGKFLNLYLDSGTALDVPKQGLTMLR